MVIGQALSLADCTERQSRFDTESGTDPLVAIVIPVYKQAQYLKQAVFSAISQSFRRRAKIVIVNDGCPHSSTDWLGKYFCDAFPGEVYYLRKRNGGLSSARNYGIRFALAAWPSIQAVFPLDADNKLSENTIDKLWQQLAMSSPSVGWIYQDIVFFGRDEAVWQMGLPFSLYRLIHENYCEAGSLIHRRVFDADIWYDEEMRSGYEDWEFYVSAGLCGFRGLHVPGTGFLYRKHGHSMLSDARQKHETLFSYIRDKHWRSLQHRALTSLEHSEMPRFAFVIPTTGQTLYFTGPVNENPHLSTVAGFVSNVVVWASEPAPKVTYLPPITVFTREGSLDLLNRLRLSSGLLRAIQEGIRKTGFVSVILDSADDPSLVEMGLPSDTTGELVLFAMTTHKLVELASEQCGQLRRLLETASATEIIGLRIGDPLASSVLCSMREVSAENRSNLCGAILEIGRQLSARLQDGASDKGRRAQESAIPSHTDFATAKHVYQGPTTFPYCARPSSVTNPPVDVWFVLPSFGHGSLEQFILSLARGFANLDPVNQLHLVVTDANRIHMNSELPDVFDTITLLSGNNSDRGRALADMLSAGGLVFNALSLLGYEILPDLKRNARTRFISYMPPVDADESEVLSGFHLLAARQYEYLIDHFIVASEQLKRICLNANVPEEKILVAYDIPTESSSPLESPLIGLAAKLAK